MKKITSIFCTVTLLLSLLSIGTLAVDNSKTQKEKVKQEMQLTATYLLSQLEDKGGAKYTDDALVYLIIKSGIDCSQMKEQYISDVKKALENNDGKLFFGTTESAVYYATTALNLKLLGKDATNFYGYNLISSLENFDRQVLLSYSIYQLPSILNAATVFDSKIQDKTLVTDVISTLTSQFNPVGSYDYYGISVDNNAMVVPALAPYYNSDLLVKEQLDKALAWTYAQKVDGGYMYSPTYPDDGNGNSTGLALSMFSAMNESGKANEAFNLLMNFKSTQTQGMYTAYGNDSNATTKDAMTGLVAYYDFIVATEPSVTETTITTTNPTTTKPSTTNETISTTVVVNDSKTSPNTGDNSYIIIFSLVAVSSVAAIVLLNSKKVRGNEA